MDMNLAYNTACNAYENEDYQTSFELFFDLAKEGDVSSQVSIAYMLLNGIGVEKNIITAYECYKQAADNGDTESQYYYGCYCINNENSEGLKYLILASNSDYTDAVYDLAGGYYFGMYFCEQDFDKAMELYERATLLGKREAFGDFLKCKGNKDGKFKTLIYMLKNFSRLTKNFKA